MKKLKKILIVLLIILASLYALFFIGVSAFGNLNKYLPQIQSLTKDMLGLDIDVKTANLTPTPKVEIKLTVEDFILKYPDSKKIVSVD